MGIDVYLKWEGQSAPEQESQITGFSVTSGEVGYLREAYHGTPYATMVLFPECWESCNSEHVYAAATLRERLPEALEIAALRERKVYNSEPDPDILRAYTDFVELAERKEKETGKPVTVYVSY